MTFDPTELRDERGRWTRGGSGTVSADVDPRVLDVSGDEWNKKTAARLEQEYARVRPELDQIAQKAADEEVEITGGSPGSWDDMTDSAQEEAESHYKANNLDSEYDHEVQSWHDNGDSLNDAKHALADDDDFKAEFIKDFLEDRDEDGEHIPYTAQQLTDALEVHADDEGDDPEVKFNLDFLSEPDNLNPNFSPDQMALPGIDAPQPKGSDSFTSAIHEELNDAFIKAFNEKAADNSSDVEPPEYLKESAEESVADQWAQMDDEQKYEWTKQNTQLLEDDDGSDENTTTTVEIPKKFDPLNTTSGEDYRRTQALAKYMSDQRAAQLITLRTDAGTIGGKGWKPRSEFLGDDASYEKLYGPGGVGAKKDAAWTERMLQEIRRVDFNLWSGWKSSSTGSEGMLLQVAAAEELGGRLREAKPEAPAFNHTEFALAASVYNDKMATEAQIADAKKILDVKGGPEGPLAKAYYTKFAEHTSFAEKEAAQKVIEEAAKAGKRGEEDGPPVVKSERWPGGYTRLPELNIVRNGAASTTASRDVANGWGGTTNYAPSGINKKEIIAAANKDYASIGGFEGVKAAIRAKWETTQYLLDRADLPVVEVYRGMTYPHKPDTAAPFTGDFNAPFSGIVQGYSPNKHPSDAGPIDLKEASVGTVYKIASGKTITKVSDQDLAPVPPGVGTWKYEEPPSVANRVVLRAELPRTAIVSVPAYGVNVKSEQEVVAVGTAWKNWDAWSGRAPSFEDVPMQAKSERVKSPELTAKIAAKLAEFESKKKKLSKAEEVEYANLMKELDAV